MTRTPSQQLAVTTVDRGVIVSAAAGSGKTRTLADRVAHLVCEHDCPLDRILVVTFTESAAAEMRARIERTLREQALACGTPHARRQVLLAGRAAVGTIHSFCSRLIRQHFQHLGIDPRFGILPAEEGVLLRSQILRKVLDAAHLRRSPAFERLIEYFGQGDDDRVGAYVHTLHALAASLIDPPGWRRLAIQSLEHASLAPESSPLGQRFIAEARVRLHDLDEQCRRFIALSREPFPKYAAFAQEHFLPLLHDWLTQLSTGDPWALPPAPDFPRAPGYADSVEGKKRFSDLVTSLRKELVRGPYPGGIPPLRDFWQTSLASTLPHVRELVALTEAFEQAYLDAKSARRVLDFADLERYALTLLQTPAGDPSDVARQLNDHYLHVLVDESQDINAVQDRILSLVSRDHLRRAGGAASNLFSVGDVKQSIYRFRLAEPGLFEQRVARSEESPPPGSAASQVIRLSENFRSRGPLLAAVNAVFSRLMVGGRTDIDYTQGHLLVAGRDFPAATFPGAPLELHLLQRPPRASSAADPDPDTDSDTGSDTDDTPSDADDLELIEREAELVARRIRELMGLSGSPRATVADRDGGVRPIRYSDIAVLLRVAAVKAKQFAAMLRRRGIPVHADVRGGLLEAQEVRDVISLLQLLDNPERDLPLAAYLRSPLSLLAEPEEALARARLAFPDGPLHRAVTRYTDAHASTDPYAAALADALHRAQSWRDLARRRNVADVLEDIYTRTCFTGYAAGLLDGEQRRANLLELLEHARTYSRNPGSDLGGFATFIAALENEQQSLSEPAVVPGGGENFDEPPDEPGHEPAAADGNAAAPRSGGVAGTGGGGGVVTVQTVHRSKGLEYPVVFLPDLATKFNTSDRAGPLLLDREAGIAPMAVSTDKHALYPSPAWALARSLLTPRAIAEELRVLYVALTRASEHLILVGTTNLDAARAALTLHAPPPPPPPPSPSSPTSAPPLPEPTVLSAKAPLDWILMTGHACSVTFHDDAAIQSWTAQADTVSQAAIPPEILALDPLPPLSAPASFSAVVNPTSPLLDWRYPHERIASVRAAVSVSALTHGPTPTPADGRADLESPPPTDHAPPPHLARADETAALPPDPTRDFPLPRLLANVTPSLPATELGTATHLALEHLDFSQPPTPEALTTQLEKMVARELLTRREADSIKLSDLRFVVEHPTLGRLLRGELGPVYRELPIYTTRQPDDQPSANSPPTDPRDCQMVRGRIDVMVDTPEGPVVIDYKTDHVWDERLEERVRLYQGQVHAYRDALKRLTGRDCAAVYLVFVNERARTLRKL